MPLTPSQRCLKTVGGEVSRIWSSMRVEVRRKEKETVFYSQRGVGIVVPSPLIGLQRRNKRERWSILGDTEFGVAMEYLDG